MSFFSTLRFREIPQLFREGMTVYVLTSLDPTLDEPLYYVGDTTNLLRAVKGHNKGYLVATKSHRPWALVAVISGFQNDNFHDASTMSLQLRDAIDALQVCERACIDKVMKCVNEIGENYTVHFIVHNPDSPVPLRTDS